VLRQSLILVRFVRERHPLQTVLLRPALFDQPLLRVPVSICLDKRFDCLRLAVASDVSYEEHALCILVFRVDVSDSRANDSATLRLREPVVDWALEHDILDPFIWDLQFCHDHASISVTGKITSNLPHLRFGRVMVRHSRREEILTVRRSLELGGEEVFSDATQPYV